MITILILDDMSTISKITDMVYPLTVTLNGSVSYKTSYIGKEPYMTIGFFFFLQGILAKLRNLVEMMSI
jgi:hypothetical protein